MTISRVLILFAAALALLATAPPSSAQEPPPDEAALVDQYAEAIPTASGPKQTGGGGSGGSSGEPKGVPLSTPVAASLSNAVPTTQAKRLREVATSPRLGAPSAALHAPDEGGVTAGSEGSPVSATFEALSSAGSGSLGFLYLVLGLIAGAMVGAAFLQRRERAVAR
jgi:hypothetical protein